MQSHRSYPAQADDTNRIGGFTLIEMAIVMLISGLIIAGWANFYSAYISDQERKQTKANAENIISALSEFYANNGRYPCPANPTLAPTDAGFGEEQCRATTGTGPCPAGLTCTDVGTRDADLDGNPDPVLLGAVPSRTLVENKLAASFVEKEGIDGYGNKFAYAVSELMTDDAAYSQQNPVNPNLAVVNMRDEEDRNLAPVNSEALVSDPGAAAYLIWSFGENGRGAHTEGGIPVGDCNLTMTAAPAPPGTTIGTPGVEPELENCDFNDGIIVKAPHSIADNDNYFDDLVYYDAPGSFKIWRDKPGSDAIFNLNYGGVAVGAGLTDPTMKLHVAGSIKAMDRFYAEDDFCDTVPSDIAVTECVSTDFMGDAGAGFACPAGTVATGIELNRLVCEPITIPIPSTVCGVDGMGNQQFITAISSDGDVTCATPP